MAWIESHQSLGTHLKLKRLARELNVHRAQAIGHLHILWWWSLDNAPSGDLSALSSVELAEVSEWPGNADKFAAALKACGWVDADGMIHDWWEYAGRLIQQREKDKQRKREKRTQQNDVSAGRPSEIHGTSVGIPADGGQTAEVPNPTQPNRTNPTQQNQPKTPLPPSPHPSNPEASAGASLVQNEASAVVIPHEASKTPEDGKAAQGGGSKKRVTPMQIPTLEEVKLHALKIGLPENEAQKFYGYYESNGWRVGKNPMRSWTGAMTNWKGNYDERRTGPAGPHHGRADGNPPAIRSEAGMAGIDAWRDDFKREADNHVNDDLPFA